MIKILKRLNNLESRVKSLEKVLESLEFNHGVSKNEGSSAELSYKEVLDEWLNGKN